MSRHETVEKGRDLLFYGHKAVARLLLENGANVVAKDRDGGTALYQAAWNREVVMVRLLTPLTRINRPHPPTQHHDSQLPFKCDLPFF